LLASGRLAEGWNHYEFRWLGEPFLSLRPSYGRPTWSGQDLSGKTILLRAEQGFGDTIQFLRYAPRLKMMGATVVLHVIQVEKRQYRRTPASFRRGSFLQ